MQFTTVRSKEKDYDIYLKSEKLVHRQQELRKKCFQAIWKCKTLVPSYFDKHGYSYLEREKSGSLLFGDQKMYKHEKNVSKLFCKTLVPSSYLEREKSGSLLFGDQKMQFTTVRSKEKDYDIYLKSEKLVHSNQEHEKNVSQLFGSAKHWFLAISSLTNTVAAIWREKKVDPYYFETKKCSSQLLGARKNIMTSI